MLNYFMKNNQNRQFYLDNIKPFDKQDYTLDIHRFKFVLQLKKIKTKTDKKYGR